MKTKIISINNQRMSSLEIAKLCGKNHKDVMRAIRNMEPAWEKTAQGKFSLGSLQRPLQPTSPTNTVGQSHCARNMEPAWEKTCGLKFQLTSRTIIQPNGGTRKVPCYQLTKTECLYIATKFNDETGFIVSSLCGSEVFGSELRLLFSLFT